MLCPYGVPDDESGLTKSNFVLGHGLGLLQAVYPPAGLPPGVKQENRLPDRIVEVSITWG